jgi:LysR family hydrogen peroxide-inducible transcriptional activator
MQLAQIKYFLAACDTTNFTHAAKACNVTQPALTRSIRMLEEELGGALFLREHHMTQLTPFGTLMRAHFDQILADTERLRDAARQYNVQQSAAFTVGIMPTIGPSGFKELLKQFGAANKALQINLIEGARERLAAALLDGTLHLAILVEAAGADARFTGIRLYHERYLVAFAQGHRFQEMASIRLGELAKERQVTRPDCSAAAALRQACRERNLELETELTSEAENWGQIMVAAGLGVMLVPETASLAAGIATRPIADLRLERDIQLVASAGRAPAPAIARFIRAAQSNIWTRATSAA